MKINQELIDRVLEIAKKAGDGHIMPYFQKDEVKTEIKDDNSPVTIADKEAGAFIEAELKKINDLPILCEESFKDNPFDISATESYWLVDPLDGTKEFINKRPEFTVNIALIHNGKPIFGVVYVPASEIMYYGAEGFGSFKKRKDDNSYTQIHAKETLDKQSFNMAVSYSHMGKDEVLLKEALEKSGCSVNMNKAGSSLKFCLVADGSADIYFRSGPTMYWDSGAAHAVAKFAGALLLDKDTKRELSYSQNVLKNSPFIVCNEVNRKLVFDAVKAMKEASISNVRE